MIYCRHKNKTEKRDNLLKVSKGFKINFNLYLEVTHTVSNKIRKDKEIKSDVQFIKNK